MPVVAPNAQLMRQIRPTVRFSKFTRRPDAENRQSRQSERDLPVGMVTADSEPRSTSCKVDISERQRKRPRVDEEWATWAWIAEVNRQAKHSDVWELDSLCARSQCAVRTFYILRCHGCTQAVFGRVDTLCVHRASCHGQVGREALQRSSIGAARTEISRVTSCA